MSELNIIASVSVVMAFTGTITALTSSSWSADSSMSVGLLRTCFNKICLNVLYLQPEYVQATFGLMIASAFCSLMTFIYLMINHRRHRKHLVLVAHIFSFLATMTLLSGCTVWTGFTWYLYHNSIAQSIRNGVFPFGCGFFMAWMSMIMSVIASSAIYSFRRRQSFGGSHWPGYGRIRNQVLHKTQPPLLRYLSRTSFSDK